MQIDGGAHDQSQEGNAVRDHLYCLASALESFKVSRKTFAPISGLTGLIHTPKDGLATHWPHQR